MTIHMLFFTISIKKKSLTREEAFHQESIREWHDKKIDRVMTIGNIM
ncbi:YrzI family small protein [Peribacillus deserti]|uniref:YrzI family protein n=1 Tax=Peribacillus deserti TaxID=673318 RepID=A0A2N5M977_9BACI|nr:YrzI family small protein [Peribacillus deserti]PLT30916.1 YrzI family protein [Peribacillus deserti]